MKKFARYSKVLALGTALVVLPMFSGCTDDEVAQAVGAAAIVAGAVAIGATTHCEAGYDTVCHNYVDAWGHTVGECQQVYDSCAHLVPNDNESLRAGNGALELEAAAPAAAPQAAKPASPEDRVNSVNWGMRFGISFQASQKVIDAFKAARDNRNASALFDLGLSSDDIRDLARKQLPSGTGIVSVSRRLNQSPAAIQAMFQTLIANH